MQEKTVRNVRLSTECSGTARNLGGSRGPWDQPQRRGNGPSPGGLRPLSTQPCTQPRGRTQG